MPELFQHEKARAGPARKCYYLELKLRFYDLFKNQSAVSIVNDRDGKYECAISCAAYISISIHGVLLSVLLMNFLMSKLILSFFSYISSRSRTSS